MPIQDVAREENRMFEVLAGRAGVQALGGVAAIVLAIIGLSNVAQRYMLGVSTIVIGAALLAMAMGAAAEYRRVSGEEGVTSTAEIGGGASVGVLGGIAAIVLGILALLGIATDLLCAIAAIAVGAALSLSAGVPAKLTSLPVGPLGEESHLATSAGAGTMVLIGLSVIVLGILAVVGIARPTLTLVAFLAAGAGLLVSGMAIGSSAVSAVNQ